jgi:hypothetical protein
LRTSAGLLERTIARKTKAAMIAFVELPGDRNDREPRSIGVAR